MNIAITTTVWGRMHITRPVLEHYKGMSMDHNLSLHAVCSCESDGRQVEDIGDWEVHSFPNSPLNEKHNRAVDATFSSDPDMVCVVNSDDVLTEEYLRRAAKAVLDGADMVRLIAYVMINTVTGEAAFSPSAFPASGVVFSRALLERLDWAPWAGDPIDKWLDTRLMDNIHEHNPPAIAFQQTPVDPVQICSLKGESNIWTFNEHLEMLEICSNIDGEDYLQDHFPEIYPKVYNAELQRTK